MSTFHTYHCSFSSINICTILKLILINSGRTKYSQDKYRGEYEFHKAIKQKIRVFILYYVCLALSLHK